MLGYVSLGFVPRLRKVMRGIHALKVRKRIVELVAVAVVYVAALGDRPKGSRPNIAVKPLAAARQILLARPKTVEAAIEILRERVKDDWISEPLWRLLADVHPLTVQNI